MRFPAKKTRVTFRLPYLLMSYLTLVCLWCGWTGKRTVTRQEVTNKIGRFRVPPGLCIKTRLSAQPWIWKWFFILMQMKLIFTRKVVHLASLELGSGLFLGSIGNQIFLPMVLRCARECSAKNQFVFLFLHPQGFCLGSLLVSVRSFHCDRFSRNWGMPPQLKKVKKTVNTFEFIDGLFTGRYRRKWISVLLDFIRK